MARPKDDLSKLSINQLEVLTGSTYRTIKKLLSSKGLEPVETDDNSILYDPREALPIIFEAQNFKIKTVAPSGPMSEEQKKQIKESLDPFIQRARKDRAQADKYEFELEVLRKNYIPAADTQKSWEDMVTNFRIKVLALAPTLTPTLFAVKDIKKFEKKWDDINRETLEALSQYEPDDD